MRAGQGLPGGDAQLFQLSAKRQHSNGNASTPDTALYLAYLGASTEMPTRLPEERFQRQAPDCSPGRPHTCRGSLHCRTTADLGVAPLGDALPAEEVAAGRGSRVPALLQAQSAQGASGDRSLFHVAPVGGGELSLAGLAECRDARPPQPAASPH